MKKLLLTILLLLPLPIHALETLSAGFATSPRVIPEILEAGKPARIYTTLFNQTNFDLTGSLQFYYNGGLINEVTIILPAQSNVRYWSDTNITSGTQRFSTEIHNMRKNELGKIPEPVLISTSSLQTEKEAGKTPSSSTISSPTSTTSFITVSSVTSSGPTSTEGIAPSLSSSTASNILSSPLTQKTVSTTKTVIQTITHPLVRLLDEKQYSLEQEMSRVTSSEPIPALDQAATELEKKSTFFKIPREKLPTIYHLYIWLIIAAKYILNTWWIMLIILLCLLRIIWKLVRRLRSEEYS